MNVRVHLRTVPGRSILYSALAGGVVSDGRSLTVFTRDHDCEFGSAVSFDLPDIALIEIDDEGACLC